MAIAKQWMNPVNMGYPTNKMGPHRQIENPDYSQ
jgi:hypothetical protein